MERKSPGTVVLFIFQSGYHHAKSMYKRRQIAQNPKSTMIWSHEQEDEWKKVLSNTRHCKGFWVGCQPKEKECQKGNKK